MYNKNNVFAKIINKSVPSTIIYEDDDIIAFNDINPVAPVHIIIIPKKEYIDYSDFITKATSNEIINYYTKLSHIAELAGLRAEGYRLVTNQGVKAGQSIFHFHFHLIGGKGFAELISLGEQ